MVEPDITTIVSKRDPPQSSSQEVSHRNCRASSPVGSLGAIESPLSALREALRRVGPYSITRTTRMTLTADVMKLEGRVASYYHRQLLIETCRRICPELRIIDQVSVGRPERWFNSSKAPEISNES